MFSALFFHLILQMTVEVSTGDESFYFRRGLATQDTRLLKKDDKGKGGTKAPKVPGGKGGPVPSPTSGPVTTVLQNFTISNTRNLLDTLIDSRVPASTTGHGSAFEIDVFKYGVDDFEYGLIQWFDLTVLKNCVNNQVSLAQMILSASDGTVNPVVGYRMGREWDEASTWNSLLAPDGLLTSNDLNITAVIGNDAFKTTTFNVVRDINYWLQNPEENHGWVFKTDDAADGYKFLTRDTQTPERHPKLVVQCLVPL